MAAFDLERPLPFSDDQLFEAESKYSTLPLDGADPSLHTAALSFYTKDRRSRIVSPTTAYVAANYLDRFLACRTVPEGKSQLLILSCLTLAGKVVDASFSTRCAIAIFHREEGLRFKECNVTDVEQLVIRTIGYQLRSITPFAFIPYFLDFFCSSHRPSFFDGMRQSVRQIITENQKEVKLLRFRPSVIAAMAVISAATEGCPSGDYSEFYELISCSDHLDKKELDECLAVMQVQPAGGSGSGSASTS